MAAMKNRNKQKANAPKRKNPLLALKKSDDIEKNDAEETAVVLKELKEASTFEKAVKNAGNDNRKIQQNGFWLCLVFVTEDQRNEFVRNANWKQFADISDSYYDGVAIAEHLGVELTPENIPFRDRGPDRKITEQTGIIPYEEQTE